MASFGARASGLELLDRNRNTHLPVLCARDRCHGSCHGGGLVVVSVEYDEDAPTSPAPVLLWIHRAWGAAPFTDLMAVTDATVARADIDETRTAAMGGSFGGYMANWVAGHTDRFRAIVTHASLWALDQFGPTTDDATTGSAR